MMTRPRVETIGRCLPQESGKFCTLFYKYGGLKVDQVKRLKALEAENTRLRRAVSDLTLEKLVLKEAASGNF